MRTLKLRGNKYGARAWEYGGRTYASKLEAAHAAKLDLLVKAGEVSMWEPQHRMPININGTKVCDYVVDFVVCMADGTIEHWECKGYPTPMGNLKMKMFRAMYPDAVLKVFQ